MAVGTSKLLLLAAIFCTWPQPFSLGCKLLLLAIWPQTIAHDRKLLHLTAYYFSWPQFLSNSKRMWIEIQRIFFYLDLIVPDGNRVNLIFLRNAVFGRSISSSLLSVKKEKKITPSLPRIKIQAVKLINKGPSWKPPTKCHIIKTSTMLKPFFFGREQRWPTSTVKQTNVLII